MPLSIKNIIFGMLFLKRGSEEVYMKYGYFNTIEGFLKEFKEREGAENFVEKLSQTLIYINHTQKNAWKGMFSQVYNLFKKLKDNKNLGQIHCIFEYFLPFSDERIDLIFLGSDDEKPVALIFELKGWKEVSWRNDFTVQVNNQIHQHPELQLNNYLNKLKFTHSESQHFSFHGFLWFYNLSRPNNIQTQVRTYFNDEIDQIANEISQIIRKPLQKDFLDKFINGEYSQTKKLFDAIKTILPGLKQNLIDMLCSSGFGPSEDQLLILSEILESIRSNSKKAFFIQGEPGSGKTYLAIVLLLEIINKLGASPKNLVALGYRNNRLINTIRNLFRQHGQGLDTFLKFYSTGRNTGLAEGDPKNPHYKVVIYDEAQRMTKDNIRIALQRGDITVFFYDEKQILNADEEGWRENFTEAAKNLNIPFEERTLTSVHRVKGGKEYHEFVENLFLGNKNQKINFKDYKFIVFDDIESMLNALKSKVGDNRKVALVASFTESPGDRKNPTKNTCKNLRVGHPLYSGFEHYRDKNLKIYWLMDEKNQYPEFWIGCTSNNLTHCASIYGCQGFEADYVGVIWGRDLVWRDGKWELGTNCEDTVGKPSLKELMRSNKQSDLDLAKKLLINRYRIFLTRGILGTFIYCEDEATKKYLKNICE